ncbi:cytochrome c oxidase subunit 4 isoform 2, mitochondrial-like [Cydia pomonella]|uniref:cytochrome c oxidase subunit 4 isoform 2, mitochondrial-like n=1 Tax=Cydia pomonella TaxID=82600 RepID=UPI002ADE847F|nr:cytochrome c oxidase subunit 4 isoform 2, mitochondrial-like [Cydia pomonella]
MAMLKSRFNPAVRQARNITNRCRIGTRDVVGYGHNGGYNYKDDPHFPFPAIRFKENTRDIVALRQKECGDWKMLCCEEKKALYRASFCQTFSEFQHPTHHWKIVIGGGLFFVSWVFWHQMIYRNLIAEPNWPDSFSLESRMAQLRRMLELRVQPIDGLSSLWDYDNDCWKK